MQKKSVLIATVVAAVAAGVLTMSAIGAAPSADRQVANNAARATTAGVAVPQAVTDGHDKDVREVAQGVKVLSIQELKLPEGMMAVTPVISPDGSFVVYNTLGALERMDIGTGRRTRLASLNDAGATEVTISPDGEDVAWRESTFTADRRRMVGVKSVKTDGSKAPVEVVKPSRETAAGIQFAGGEVRAVDGGRLKARSTVDRPVANGGMRADKSAERPVVSIYQGHLQVTDGSGNSRYIDPQGRGSYLWPQLSPNGRRISYYCVGQGCYVCNVDGTNPVFVNQLHSVAWAGNNHLVGMMEYDDGETIVASDVRVSDLRGNMTIISDPSHIAIEPTATADGRTVVYATADGRMFLVNLAY